MNFLIDENVDRQIADSLRLMRHHVGYVAEKDTGISDDEVLDMACNKSGVDIIFVSGFFRMTLAQ